VLAVSAAAVLGLVGFVDAVGDFGARADRLARLSAEDRAYGFVQSPELWPPRDIVDDVRTAIPESGEFRVEFGPDWRVGQMRWTNALTAGFLRFHLLPRRQSPTAEWVLCFACDESKLGGEFSVLSESPDGLRFGRIAR
jgi:hypothetical protein